MIPDLLSACETFWFSLGFWQKIIFCAGIGFTVMGIMMLWESFKKGG